MAEPTGCIHDPKRGYAIHTWSGKAFFPQDVRPEDVCIEDIAHGLSMTCRFGGQSDQHYTVSQHSVYCFELAPPEYKREALLHDAVEAYLGVDFPRPYKLMVTGLVEFEHMIERQLNPILGIPVTKSDVVRDIDETMLATEMPLLFQKHGAYIERGGQLTYTGDANIIEGLPQRLGWRSIPEWTPAQAEERFLDAYDWVIKHETKGMAA